MKTFLKILGGLMVLVALVALGGYLYLTNALPKVSPAPDLVIEADSAMLERGKYLVEHQALCVECHTPWDMTIFGAPIKEDLKGSGGNLWSHETHFPGRMYSVNITSGEGGIGAYTDGELYRLLTTGVKRDGEPMFPLMPVDQYAQLAPEDLHAIIAYVRTLKPIDQTWPKAEIDFPMNLIMRTIPKDLEKPGERPHPSDTLNYGKYVLTASLCQVCHNTADEKHQPLPGMHMAGGTEFVVPGNGIVRTANLTPDKETGIGNWTLAEFLSKFRKYSDSSYVPVKVNKGEFQSMMPYKSYSGMTDEDLTAIYKYLMNIAPVKHMVVKFTPEGEQAIASTH